MKGSKGKVGANFEAEIGSAKSKIFQYFMDVDFYGCRRS